MSKWGYGLLTLAIIALAFYVMRPEESENKGIVLVSGPPPMVMTVTVDGVEQRIVNRTVQVKGLELQASAQRIDDLWNLLRSVEIPPERMLADIAAGDLVSYGIDGRSRIEADGLQLQWGSRDGQGALFDGRRLCVVDERLIKNIASKAARLDEERLIVAAGEVTALQVDDLEVVRQGTSYFAPAQPQRPDFQRRAQSLLKLLGRVRLAELENQLPKDARKFAQVRLVFGDQSVGQSERLLTFYEQGQAGLIICDDLPPQPLSAAVWAQFADLIDSFKDDYLFNVDNELVGSPIQRVEVRRDGVEWFTLERRGKQDSVSGATQWDLQSADGHRNGSAEAVHELAEAFNDLTVRDVRHITGVDAMLPPGSRQITLIGTFQGEKATMTLFDRQVRNATHQGRVKSLADIVENIAPDRFLDLRLVNRHAKRVTKLQRRWLSGDERGEVFALGDNGAWRCTYPNADPIEEPAVVRLAETIAAARARSAHIPSEADLRLLQHAEFEFAIRFAPLQDGHANDSASIDETAESDVAWVFSRVDGSWRAIDKDGETAYDLDDDLVAALQAPVQGRHMLPIIASEILTISVAFADQSYVIAKTVSGGYVLQVAGGDAEAADAVAVRNFLNRLSDLQAERIDTGATALAADEIAGTITCGMGLDEDERPQKMILRVGREHAGEVALVAESTRMGAVPKGRGYIKAEAAIPLLQQPASFVGAR
jgi:hypothetical protein